MTPCSVKLTDLEGRFLRRVDDKHYENVDTIEEADGVLFLCPTCFKVNQGAVGTHSVICWQPHVPQSTFPRPGRWKFEGTGLSDLTLVAGSSSILLKGGCNAHFFIRNGLIT